jgi:DNA polymerase-3 subunit alpha
MVGYLLGLCNVDPIRYGLLFERFMDPSRDEMPDIDIDICQDGRAKIIEYVRNKYGHVAQIITFGTLAARAVCKDVGRVMGVPLALTDKMTKLIPAAVGMTLERALEQSPELRKLYQDDAQVRQIVEVGKRLEGLCRNAGTHAAGVVIADQPLENLLPLCKSGDDLLTQFEGPIVEKVGLLKMDFLGLRTLTTLERSIKLVKQIKGIDVDIEKIDFADRKVLELFCRGETKGVFQFESGGMRDLLMKMRPDRLEDLIAANALYRPGPMELIPLYCNRKHGTEKPPQAHPIMDRILAETYGIMVYQEQVMQILNQLGGIELSAAYKLVKAISKKQTDVIARYEPEFLAGAQDNGIGRERAGELFESILKFGGYGFNKSHSTRYAIIAFQTAYMKTYHPVEYMAALLTYEMGSTEKVVEYIEECRRMTQPDGSRGIPVQPPDVNVSEKDFTPIYVNGRGNIRFGLMAVRGVGEKAVEAILAEREKSGPFTSLYDFCERVDQRQVTRGTIEALVKCGAFSSLKARRSQLLAILDRAVEMGQQSQQDKRIGQMSMFGSMAAKSVSPAEALPNFEEFPSSQLLKFEKEFLGFYVTTHPLTAHAAALENYSTATTRQIKTMPQGAEVTLGGLISRVRRAMTKTGRSAGQPMCILTLEDLDGQVEATIFAESLADITKKYPQAIAAEQIVFIRGRVDRRRETPGVIVSEVVPIAAAMSRFTRCLKVEIDRIDEAIETLRRLKSVFAKHKGHCQTFLSVPAAGQKRALIVLDKQWSIRATPQLKEELELVLNGQGRVELAGDGAGRRPAAQRPLFQEAQLAEPPDQVPATPSPAEEMEIL